MNKKPRRTNHRRTRQMRLVRDLGRRKLRSGLTITGIAIGIMALVVFGSMANKMNALIGGGSKYYQGKIVASVGSMYAGGVQPMALSDVCLLYTSPSPRDGLLSRMPSSA